MVMQFSQGVPWIVDRDIDFSIPHRKFQLNLETSSEDVYKKIHEYITFKL